jgi:hypothetical protein
MSELSGTAAVGIETVEWLDGGSGNLIVRVTGRWRRRRPASTAQVTLVIESDGRRHRFPAMPEPPSLGGTGPGMWRLSFSVPGSLAPAMGGHIWLALGTVTVPLPAPGVGERGVRQPPAGDSAPFALPAPAEEPVAVAGIDELVRQLENARADRDQLAATLAELDRTRRIAEQRAHAEQALRRDLARRLAGREREAGRAREALGDLAAAEDRIRTLERELTYARRRADEAEQQAAAVLARTRAQRAARPNEPPSAGEREAVRLGFERRLRARQAETVERVPAEPPPPPPAIAAERPPPPPAVAPEPPPPPLPPVPGLVDTLRRELDARAAGEAGLRSRLVAAETRLAARVLLDQRTTATLHELREELGRLTGALARERAARQAAERRAGELERRLHGERERSRDAYDAIGELRGALERLAAPSAAPVAATPPAAVGGATPAPTGPVQVDRLSDALARLRESVATPETTAVAGAAGGHTLESAFRRLVKRDADTAGELLLDLLGLQRAAYPHPVAYDLVLGPGRGVVRVTVGDGAPSVERHGAARTREEIDFRVTGTPARIARLLRAHGIWRRLGPRVARVRGRRDGLVALEALLALPLDLAALRDAGATLRAESVLGMVAAMVEPGWTAGERFVIAHRDSAGRVVYLIARDGRALEVTQTAPPGRIAATVDGPPDALVSVLSGAPSPNARLSGDEGPLASLRAWIANAQRG